MKKKLIGAAIAAVVLMVMFAACGPEEVIIVDYAKVSGPSNVKAVQTATSKQVIVTWDAADEGESYSVYFQQKDKKTVNSVYSGGTNDFTYSVTDGVSVKNIDDDKWSAKLGINSPAAAYAGELTTGSYRFGVRTDALGSLAASDIEWTDYIQVAY